MTGAKAVTCLAMLALLAGLVFTQQPAADKRAQGKADAPAALALRATVKVEKKPFKIARTVQGIVAAEETAEIRYRPHAPASQGPITIRTIVEHGSHVKQGDLLVAFERSKIDEVIADLERDMKGLEANLKLAEEELPLFEKSMPIELAAAETAKKRADEEVKYFLEVDRAQQQKQADWSVKAVKFYKEYAEEELQQLEKMYKANDLTESTEKMILRRQQNQVESALFSYQAAVIKRDQLVKFTLPNKEKSLKEDQLKQDLQLAKAQKTLGPAALQKQVALSKMRFERDKNVVRLDKLVKDRAALTVHSPIAGVVYYGKFQKGNWTGFGTDKLVKGGSVSADEVFLTVVKPRPVVVPVTIAEKDVHLFKPGLEGKAQLLVHPERKLAARLTRLAAVPAAPGKFDAEVVLEIGPGDADVMPGMACSVQFVPYAKKDALAVPSASIHEEGDQFFVDVLGANNRPEKRKVTPGRTDGEHTEILDGLREGEEVCLEGPGPKTAPRKQTAEPAPEKGSTP